jgi:hypothetical protein
MSDGTRIQILLASECFLSFLDPSFSTVSQESTLWGWWGADKSDSPVNGAVGKSNHFSPHQGQAFAFDGQAAEVDVGFKSVITLLQITQRGSSELSQPSSWPSAAA